MTPNTALDTTTGTEPTGPSAPPASPPESPCSFTFIGELLLALWLVTRGPRLTLNASGPQGRPTAAPITTAP